MPTEPLNLVRWEIDDNGNLVGIFRGESGEYRVTLDVTLVEPRG